MKKKLVTLYPPDSAHFGPNASVCHSGSGNGPYLGYANPQTPISVDSIGMGLVRQFHDFHPEINFFFMMTRNKNSQNRGDFGIGKIASSGHADARK